MACSASRPTPPKRPMKQLAFGGAELIPTPGACAPADECASPVIYTLPRSPTPLIELKDIDKLTEEHLTQLNAVWREGKLPSFAADSKEISRTMKALAAADPFD